MANNDTKRNLTIDAVKGFAIILVACGHTNGWKMLPDWTAFLCSFHMQLFMMMSGFCAYSATKKTDINWLKSRARTVFLPFWVIVLIQMYRNYHFELTQCFDFLKRILSSPDCTYWFMFTLFELCFALFVCNWIIDKLHLEKFDYIVYLFCVLFFNVLFWRVYFQILGMYLLSWHSFFYFLGYYMHKHDVISKLDSLINNKIVWVIVIILAVVFFPMWRRVDTPAYVTYFNSVVGIHKIQKLFEQFMRYLVPSLGVYCTYILMRMIPMWFKSKLAYIGQYTLEIYVLHRAFFFEYTTIWQVNFILDIAVSIAISILIANIVEKGILSRLLFGKKTVII